MYWLSYDRAMRVVGLRLTSAAFLKKTCSSPSIVPCHLLGINHTCLMLMLPPRRRAELHDCRIYLYCSRFKPKKPPSVPILCPVLLSERTQGVAYPYDRCCCPWRWNFAARANLPALILDPLWSPYRPMANGTVPRFSSKEFPSVAWWRIRISQCFASWIAMIH